MEVVVTTGAIWHTSFSQIITTNKPTPSILQAGYPSCRQTNSVRALKGESNAYANFYLHDQMLMLTRGVFQPCLWPLKAPVVQLRVILFCFSALTLKETSSADADKPAQCDVRYIFGSVDRRVSLHLSFAFTEKLIACRAVLFEVQHMTSPRLLRLHF